MQRPTIPDKEIHEADPEQVIFCYENWIKKIANRYRLALERTAATDEDDLFQVGRLALLKAQGNYDPAEGATFLTYSYNYIRSAMRRELGFSQTGELPEILDSLDELISEDGDETRLDFIPDKTPTAEERIIEQDTKDETAEAVRSAVDRLKNSKQREVITRCWLNGQDKKEAAAEMGLNIRALQAVDIEARDKLRRDEQLKQYVMPSFHVTVNRFNSTWTSATEAAVIWREEHLPTKRTWTQKQRLAYMKRLIEKHNTAQKTDIAGIEKRAASF